MYLSVDIGGTNTRWGWLVEANDGGFELKASQEFPTVQMTDEFLPRLQAFRDQWRGPLEAIAIGIAGPVVAGTAQMTNSPLVVCTTALRETLHCPNVFLVNDLEAQAYGIPLLKEGQFVTVKTGTPTPGNKALIAVGTGLGESSVVSHRQGYLVVPSEGGHCEFGPGTIEETELLRFLLTRHTHVSWERVLSGTFGFRNIFEFFRDVQGLEAPTALNEAIREEQHIGPYLQCEAEKGTDIAVKTLLLFLRLYGAEAGNLALQTLATGGVYLGGGIAPRLLPWFASSDFAAAFAAKGRLSEKVASIPVHVITHKSLALTGAAEFARRQMGPQRGKVFAPPFPRIGVEPGQTTLPN